MQVECEVLEHVHDTQTHARLSPFAHNRLLFDIEYYMHKNIRGYLPHTQTRETILRTPLEHSISHFLSSPPALNSSQLRRLSSRLLSHTPPPPTVHRYRRHRRVHLFADAMSLNYIMVVEKYSRAPRVIQPTQRPMQVRKQAQPSPALWRHHRGSYAGSR